MGISNDDIEAWCHFSDCAVKCWLDYCTVSSVAARPWHVCSSISNTGAMTVHTMKCTCIYNGVYEFLLSPLLRERKGVRVRGGANLTVLYMSSRWRCVRERKEYV